MGGGRWASVGIFVLATLRGSIDPMDEAASTTPHDIGRSYLHAHPLSQAHGSAGHTHTALHALSPTCNYSCSQLNLSLMPAHTSHCSRRAVPVMSSPFLDVSVSIGGVDKTTLLAPRPPPSTSSSDQFIPRTRRAAFIALAVSSVLVALASYRYLVPAARFTLPTQALDNFFARPFLWIHATSAATALLVGPFQFIQSLRRRSISLHRVLGRVYVLACLIGGLAAMPLAVGATAGPVAQSGFFILAMLWVTVVSNGWRLAVQGRISEHKQWMTRSFALTFSAVTLRLIIATLPHFGVPFITAYRIASWAAWVPNLLVVESWLWYSSTEGGATKAAQPVEEVLHRPEDHTGSSAAEMTVARE